MTVKIHIHGASVTAQNSSDGYFNTLTELVKGDKEFTIQLSRTAYGASHFDLAGYFFLEDVFDWRPNFCLLEWCTTSAQSFDEIKIQHVISRLLQKNIIPVLLILPRADDITAQRKIVAQIRAASTLCKLPIIDLSDLINNDIDASKFLRDVVHTNSNGAKLYAHAIYKKIIDYLLHYHPPPLLNQINNIPNPIIYNSPSINLPAIIYEYREFEINVINSHIEIVIDGIVGPHSPFVSVCILNHNETIYRKDICLFDRWCYYERRMITKLVDCKIPIGHYKLLIKVLEKSPSLTISTDKPIPSSFCLKHFVKIDRIATFNVNLI